MYKKFIIFTAILFLIGNMAYSQLRLNESGNVEIGGSLQIGQGTLGGLRILNSYGMTYLVRGSYADPLPTMFNFTGLGMLPNGMTIHSSLKTCLYGITEFTHRDNSYNFLLYNYENVAADDKTPHFKYWVSGTGVVSSKGYLSSSDSTKKENITTLAPSLDKVLKMRVVSYNFKENKSNPQVSNKTSNMLVQKKSSFISADSISEQNFDVTSFLDSNIIDGYDIIAAEENARKEIGVLAQEIAEILPEAVRTGPDGTLYVSYNQLTAILIEAVKELYGMIDANDSTTTAKIDSLISSINHYQTAMNLRNNEQDSLISGLKTDLLENQASFNDSIDTLYSYIEDYKQIVEIKNSNQDAQITDLQQNIADNFAYFTGKTDSLQTVIVQNKIDADAINAEQDSYISELQNNYNDMLAKVNELENRLDECCKKKDKDDKENNKDGNKHDKNDKGNKDDKGKNVNKSGFDADNTEIHVAKLEQNIPNPFDKTTEITCFIPDNARNANIFIYDMQGKQVKAINIQEKGETTVKIQGAELYPGMFFYSLIIDNKEVDTKKMILTK